MLDSEDKSRLLRHPIMKREYFRELYDTYNAWKDHVFDEDVIYKSYFDKELDDSLVTYLQAILEAAKARPVIQECRTSNRIGPLKKRFGGFHIYLWRNPWDQWWSYKTTSYFDTVNQLILNGHNLPKALELLKKETGFNSFNRSLYDMFVHYDRARLGPEQSYMFFYALWFLGLSSGHSHADMLINIDTLSHDEEYRSKVLYDFLSKGIRLCDFKDCVISNSSYTKDESVFFDRIEGRIHDLFKDSWDNTNKVGLYINLRKEFNPLKLKSSESGKFYLSNLDQAARARETVFNVEKRESENARYFMEQIAMVDEKLKEVEYERDYERKRLESEISSLKQENQKVALERKNVEEELILLQEEKERFRQESERQLRSLHEYYWQLQEQIEKSAEEMNRLKNKAHYWWVMAEDKQSEIDALRTSTSWKVTAPLRKASLGCSNIFPHFIIKLKKLVSPILVLIGRFVVRKPFILEPALAFIRRYPGLQSRLRAFAISRGIIKSESSGKNAVSFLDTSGDFISDSTRIYLSPGARSFYNELNAAIKDLKGGQD